MKYLEQCRKIAEENAEKTAIVDRNGERFTSYYEIDTLSGRIAAKLTAEGYGEDSFIVLCLDRSMEYVAAYIGVIKAGCAVVPVIKSYPAERIAYIVKDCGAALLLDENFLSDIEKYSPAETASVSDSAPAVIVYTSGSTGRPKGIIHSRASFEAAAAHNMKLFCGVEDIVYGASAPMSFVVFMTEYIASLGLGGCTHILSDAVRKDARSIERYFNVHAVTISFISPQLLKIFKGADSLRRVITGSERLSNCCGNGYELLNAYGMSETLAVVCSF